MPIRTKSVTPAVKRILESAERQFARSGIDKVIMDEIAVDAGMAKASLYYYFKTKEHLFQAVIKQKEAEFIADVKEIIASDGSASDKLRAYVERRVGYFKTLAEMNILDIPYAHSLKRMLRTMFQELSEEEFTYLRKIFREGKQRREFSVVSPDQAARAFLHVVRGLRLVFIRLNAMRRIESKHYKEHHDEMIFVTEVFLKGIAPAQVPCD